MGTDLSDQWGETIGGVLLHHFGELPSKGSTLELSDLKFTVADVGENRIRRIRFKRIGKRKEDEEKPIEKSEVDT
jgi:Mg2+/Co2+ transporter CorC